MDVTPAFWLLAFKLRMALAWSGDSNPLPPVDEGGGVDGGGAETGRCTCGTAVEVLEVVMTGAPAFDPDDPCCDMK